jgi:hypothetical protein
MQQKQHRRIARPGLPVEDGEPVDLRRAIESRVFHEVVSPGRPMQEGESDRSCKRQRGDEQKPMPTAQRLGDDRYPSNVRGTPGVPAAREPR